MQILNMLFPYIHIICGDFHQPQRPKPERLFAASTEMRSTLKDNSVVIGSPFSLTCHYYYCGAAVVKMHWFSDQPTDGEEVPLYDTFEVISLGLSMGEYRISLNISKVGTGKSALAAGVGRLKFVFIRLSTHEGRPRETPFKSVVLIVLR